MTTYRFTATLNLLFVTYLGVAILGGVLFGEDVRFDTDIRPILSDYCYACHGPDSETREAELRLDLREEAMASGLIVPGKPNESELIARVLSNDPDDTMPPPDAPKQLDPEQRELLKRWIEAGAKWEEHWAFVTPRKAPLPKIENGWGRNAVDAFILERLNELDLKPNGEADRYTLGRRAALDLTGLPPRKELLDAFVSDTSNDAYELYVDKLLTSPRSGEHRARFWLDAARYGDTHGMHVDNYREMWPYRDWVIGAFNSNMPFDQFVIEQIAGDLLPESTLEQRVATGFNRCNITTAEGGAIIEEVNVRYMVDRVETTATVFLGLTAGCAVCHNHKYDPISQKEFYQLGAFFNNTTQPAMDGNQKDTPPVVALPEAEHESEWNTLQAKRRELNSELSRHESGADSWWASHPSTTQYPVANDDLILSISLAHGEGRHVDLPESASQATSHPAGQRGFRFQDDGFDVDFPTLRSDQPFSVSFWYRSPDRVMNSTIFEQLAKTKNDEGKEEHSIGWKISSTSQGGVRVELHDGKGKRIEGHRPGEEALRPRSWQHVCVRYSGGQSSSSITILVDGEDAMLRKASENYVEAVALAETPLRIASAMPTAGLSDVHLFQRWLSNDEVRLLAQAFDVKKLLDSDAAWNDLKPLARQQLVRFHDNVVDPNYRGTTRELAKTATRRDYIYSRSTTTLVMEERPTRPRAWVLDRGEYDKRREEVAPDTPAVLPPLAKENEKTTRNRLDLAKWLVRPDHPLTSRVMVNRLWQSVFGVGLVKTSEDFGVMGERPWNPALLDWLSVEFVESGWNVNHILKLMVNSAAYRQTSVVTHEKIEKDPENRFLSRGPRLRLDAEALRDQALSVSGLLRPEIGGPSVRPYQPAGLWSVVAIVGSNTGKFKQDSGNALYRRSLYTFWKRTSPPPSMAAFNAPTREQCTVRRERTNTPLQALVLMNDPQFVESARHLAQNSLRRYGDERERASWMLTAVLSAPVDDADLSDVLAAAKEFHTVFANNPEAAKELTQTGDSPVDETLDTTELAAWTMVANTLMNRDDFINKN